jgi:hypothetical protein
MSSYQIVDGYNNAGTLATFSPQPASPGILYPRRDIAVSGHEYVNGQPYTFWQYKGIIPASQYDALLTLFGLSNTVVSNEVTVKTMTDPDRTTWANYNAIIVLPVNGQDVTYERGFWRDAKFKVKLVAAL